MENASLAPGRMPASNLQAPAGRVPQGHDPGQQPTLKARIWEKVGTEFGPLILFFLANSAVGIYAATAVFMAATAVAAGFAWWREGRLPVVPLISLIFILALGAMTLADSDPYWILVRPTLMNGSFALFLFGSVAVGRPGLKMALGRTFQLTDKGWRMLSLRVALFLTALAVINEIVWRTLGVDAWAAYKTFAVLPANILFMLSQWRFAQQYRPQAA